MVIEWQGKNFLLTAFHRIIMHCTYSKRPQNIKDANDSK
jgi:hypothetical protein